MIKINNLKFSYVGNKDFIEIEKFSIDGNGIYSVIGENGSGKTTFFKLICNIIDFKTGEILLFNKNIKKIKDLSRMISYIPQNIYLHHDFPVRDFIKLGRYSRMDLWGNLNSFDEKELDDLLDSLGISHLKNKTCYSLSGGELQLVQLARAIYQGGKILVMDEPFSNIDYKHRKTIVKIIRELKKEKLILISTHDLGISFNISDHLICLKNGRIVEMGDVDTVSLKLDFIFEAKIEFLKIDGLFYFKEGE